MLQEFDADILQNPTVVFDQYKDEHSWDFNMTRAHVTKGGATFPEKLLSPNNIYVNTDAEKPFRLQKSGRRDLLGFSLIHDCICEL